MVNVRQGLVHYIAIFPIILFLDGYLTEYRYFYRFETIYLNSVLLFMFVLTPFNKKRYIGVILIFSFAVSLELVRNFQGLNAPFGGDLKLIIRSSIFFFLAFWFGCTLREVDLRYIAKSLFYLISILVLVHFFFGIGGVIDSRGVMKPIYTSYFQEGNVVAIFYTLSWINTFLYSNGKLKKAIITALALFVLSLMSSKLGVGMLLITMIGYLFRNSPVYYFTELRSLIYAALFSVLVHVVLDPKIISLAAVYMFAFILPDSAKLLHLVDKIDPIAAITSGRSVKVEFFLERLSSNDFGTVMFGSGFDVIQSNGWYIESDFFDILQSVGVIGVLILIPPMVVILFSRVGKFEISNRLSFGKSTLVFILFFSALMSGHSFISPAVLMIFGVAIGVYRACRTVEFRSL